MGSAGQELNLRPIFRSSLRALVGAVALAASACTDGPDRFTAHAPQVESRVEGDVDLHYAWLDDGTLVTLAPFHAAAGRNAYTTARLDELLGPGHLYGSLTVWRFAGSGRLALGSDGLPVVAAGSGSIAALAPSKWLPAVADASARPLLATLAGAGTLPELGVGQSLQLLIVFATAEPFTALHDVRVTVAGGGSPLALKRGRATAVAWDEFRSQPGKARFEAALGLAPTAGAKDGEGHDGTADRSGDK